MKKILCPVDFSASSINALEYAFRYAKAHDSFLHLLHVILISKGEDDASLHNEALHKLKGIEFELRKEFGEIQSLTFSVESESEEPSRAIVRIASESGFDLIMMGTNGVADVEESFFGSNSARVIRQGQIPVMVIPMCCRYEPFRKMVYASQFDQKDVENLTKLRAWVGKATLIQVVHVSDRAGLVEKATLNIFKDSVYKQTHDDKLEFHLIESDGEVDKALDKFVLDNSAGALVLLSKNRNFLERIFHRSLSKTMVYFTDYPVLVFKA